MKEEELTYILNLLDKLTGEIYDVSKNPIFFPKLSSVNILLKIQT